MNFNESLKQLQKAVKKLEEVLEQPKNDFIRDSAIQRFEFCLDLTWKTLQKFLREEKGVICNSPKDCLRESYKSKVIDYDVFYLHLVDLRNITSHTYHEKLAEEVYMELKDALSAFKTIIGKF